MTLALIVQILLRFEGNVFLKTLLNLNNLMWNAAGDAFLHLRAKIVKSPVVLYKTKMAGLQC
jgi:hypothetical protein